MYLVRLSCNILLEYLILKPDMPCCSQSVFPFSNAETSTIEYGPALHAAHGSIPKVFVLYRDPDTGEFLVAPWYTRIEFSGGQVRVDHGGVATGQVVIS